MEIFKPIPSWNSIATPKIPKVPWTWTRTIPYTPRIPREIFLNPIDLAYLSAFTLPCRDCTTVRLFIISSTLSRECNISRQLLANISRHSLLILRGLFRSGTYSEYTQIFLSFVRRSNVRLQFLQHCEIIEIRPPCFESVPRLDSRHTCVYTRVYIYTYLIISAFTFRRTKENCAESRSNSGVFIDLSRVRNWI